MNIFNFNPRRLRKRAISLIEGVLYLVVALAIIIGGIVFFQQANFNRQVNSVAGMMTSVSSYLIASTKNVSRTRADSNFKAGDSTSYVIKSGNIQSDMVDKAKGAPDTDVIRSPWGGVVTLREAAATIGGNRAPIVAARLNDLPVGACMRLGSKNKNGISMIGGNVFALGVEENNLHEDNLDWVSGEVRYMAKAGEDTDMAALAAACKGGTRDLVIYYEISGVPDTLPDMTGGGSGAGGSGTGGDGTGGSGTGGDGAGGSGDGGGVVVGFCPPPDWSWNAARSEYTFPGIGLYHQNNRHGALILAFSDPASTASVRVPASQTGDFFTFSHRDKTYTHRTYWRFSRHVERGDLTAPDPNC